MAFGDRLIQYTADVIQSAVLSCGHNDDFIGHIGGDDFIAISSMGEPQKLCVEIIRRFDEGVSAFYDKRVPDHVEDRQGNRIEASGVSLSLSLIVCECRFPVSLEEISQSAAALKKKSKSIKGSSFVYSRLGQS